MASGFEASYGGSEANIALALANLGVDSNCLLYTSGACAADVRTSHIQEVCQIHHRGFLGTVFQNGLALGHYSGEHTVHGSAHADLIKMCIRDSHGAALLPEPCR